MKKAITFFELKAMFLTELYGLLQMSLETGDFVSDGMALRIEKRIVKGANKTWKKLFRKHRRTKGFYSLKAFDEQKSEPKPQPPKVELVTVVQSDSVQIANSPPVALIEHAKD